jgi:hypothetical protein
MSITSFNCLFCHANRGRYLQILASEILGDKLSWKKGGGISLPIEGTGNGVCP